MNRWASNLWELLGLTTHQHDPPHCSHTSPKENRVSGNHAVPVRRSTPMQDRYDDLVREMKRIYQLRIRKWRSSTTGCAWEVHYRNGDISRLIESPYPRGPVSCAIFLHEVGHHAIGLGHYKPRCLEEYHAWRWALDAMEKHGFRITDSVHRRMNESLRYAVDKAKRRGLKHVPAELAQFCDANPCGA